MSATCPYFISDMPLFGYIKADHIFQGFQNRFRFDLLHIFSGRLDNYNRKFRFDIRNIRPEKSPTVGDSI